MTSPSARQPALNDGPARMSVAVRSEPVGRRERGPGGPDAAGATRWGVLVPVAVLLLGAGLRVAAHDGVTNVEAVRASLVVAWTVAGAVLIRRPALRVLGALVLGGVTLASVACLATAALNAGWRGPAGDLAAFARPMATALLPAAVLHLLLGLPDGRLVTRARRLGMLVGFLVGVATGLGLWAARPSLPTWPLWIGLFAALVVGSPPANARYRKAGTLDRQRLQWFGCATALVAEAVVVVAVLRLLVGWPDGALVVAAAATVLIPVAIAVAASNRLVTRVDRVLVHTVSVAGLTGVVSCVYLVIVLGLGRVPGDEERHLLVLSMAAAAVAAVLYVPAREFIGDVANRLVYGERQAPEDLLRNFGSRLSRAVPMDELLLQLCESLRKTLGLRAAEVWTGSSGILERTVSVPERSREVLSLTSTEEPVVARGSVSGPAWLAIWMPSLLVGREDASLRVASVCHSGQLLGLIVVERAAGGETFTPEEEVTLTELARQVGLALHNVRLDSALQASLEELRHQAAELQASRARIVAATDAERRRIERDLHDGAQQRLVALAVNLRLARDLMAEDADATGEMLDAMVDDVKDTVQEVRNLAHGIYPPLLSDRGLDEALRAAARRSSLDIEVDVDSVGRFPTQVEAAVYFCCLEALQNAAKHAPDAKVDLVLSQEQGALRFEIRDDGPGFDPNQARQGHGFTNMSDRLGAIGGTVRWESEIGHGALVSGTVPVGS